MIAAIAVVMEMRGFVTALRLLGATAGITALFCATSGAQTITLEVCMGNGGGPSCAGRNTINYTCSEYRAIGGGGPETGRALGERLCTVFTPNGPKRLHSDVIPISNRAGGECGWTLFRVTCTDVGR